MREAGAAAASIGQAWDDPVGLGGHALRAAPMGSCQGWPAGVNRRHVVRHVPCCASHARRRVAHCASCCAWYATCSAACGGQDPSHPPVAMCVAAPAGRQRPPRLRVPPESENMHNLRRMLCGAVLCCAVVRVVTALREDARWPRCRSHPAGCARGDTSVGMRRWGYVGTDMSVAGPCLPPCTDWRLDKADRNPCAHASLHCAEQMTNPIRRNRAPCVRGQDGPLPAEICLDRKLDNSR